MYRLRFKDGMIVSQVFSSKAEAKEVASFYGDRPEVITQEQALAYQQARSTNLSMHAEIMAKLEAAGYTREKASSLALEVMKGKRDLTMLLEAVK